MTNTLHRHGSAESFNDDYIVFAIPARGINDTSAVEKQRRFLEIARKYKPVNMGDASHGAIFRPSKELNPTVHWRRQAAADFDTVVGGVSSPSTVAAVFDNPDTVVAFIKELKEADLGLSINISADSIKLRSADAVRALNGTASNIHWVSSGKRTAWPTARRSSLLPCAAMACSRPILSVSSWNG